MLHETLDWLYSLERFGIKLGLDIMQQMMEAMGHPERAFKSVHVTGTNGKGSTCAFIASVLREAGFTVGLYTSPHLIRFNERIRVNGEEISDHELIYFTEKIKENIREKNIQPTFFEFTTALAFLYFAHKKVDIAVVEVGMGGRLDATNVIEPMVAVITNVALEHTEHLGKTVYQIAREKAGIIKSGCAVVTAERNKRILAYFKKVCKEKNTELFVVHAQLSVISTAETLESQEFAISGAVDGRFTIGLLGAHQIVNACAALLALRMLRERGVEIPDRALKQGLARAVWLGRLDVVSTRPLVIVDGAHNVAGMHMLRDFVVGLPRRNVLVLGIANDKDITRMVGLIAPLFEHVIVTRGNYKPAETEVIAVEARKYAHDVREVPVVREAVDAALGLAGGDGTVLFTGSLYMVGDALVVLRKKKL